MENLLDNPAWSALNTGNKNIALGTQHIKYYPANVAPFVGLEHVSAETLNTLYAIIPDGDDVLGIQVVDPISITQPWTLARHVQLLQMVCESPVQQREITADIVKLSHQHVQQMIELTKLTNPGPFHERTIELGFYEGIFDEGKLVAMAGQRMHPIPYAEISAVCTHPDYLGRGYAAQLILSQIQRIKKVGEIPFLHVANNNERAIRLYQSLGFVTRKEMNIYFISK